MALRRTNAESDLERLWLFAGCPRKELVSVSRLGARISVPAGSSLVTEGNRDTDFVVVLSGVATCEVRGETVARFGEGDFFGEISALDGGRRTATVVAESEMEVLVLDQDEFEMLLATSYSIAKRILHVSASRLRNANTLLTSSTAASAARA